MKIAAIIQARMGSTRLPGKVLKKLGNKSVLFHLVDRIKQVDQFDQVIVATSTLKRDDVIVQLCQENQVECFRGDEQNVLKRYVECAQKYKVDVIFRATSDEPFKDPKIIQKVLRHHLENKADYTGNHQSKTFPDGSTVEIVQRSALEKAQQQSGDLFDHEHVTYYIYNHPQQFKVCDVKAEGELNRPELRYTLDTEGDWGVIQAIWNDLGKKGSYFGVKEVIDFLDKNPMVNQLNSIQ